MKETKNPEPTEDSRPAGHWSRQLVRPQQRKLLSLRLGAYLDHDGGGAVSTRAESCQYPRGQAVPSTEERRTLYTLQHYLQAPGPGEGNTHTHTQPLKDGVPISSEQRKRLRSAVYDHRMAGFLC